MEHCILCPRGESLACMGMAGAHVLALPWRGLLPGICFTAMRAEELAVPRHSVASCRHAARATLTAFIALPELFCPRALAGMATLSAIFGSSAMPQEMPGRGCSKVYALAGTDVKGSLPLKEGSQDRGDV